MESQENWAKSFTTPGAQPDDLSFAIKNHGKCSYCRSGKMKVENNGQPVE